MSTCAGCGTALPPSKGPPRKWCSERCRKRQYDGTCKRCGGRFSGTDPGKRSTAFCDSCFREVRHEEAVKRHITEVHRWAALYGEPPSATDWQPSNARWAQRAYDEGRFNGHPSDATIALRDQRHRESGPWPDTTSAQKVFGSWNALMVAAGYPPVSPGSRRHLIGAA